MSGGSSAATVQRLAKQCTHQRVAWSSLWALWPRCLMICWLNEQCTARAVRTCNQNRLSDTFSGSRSGAERAVSG